MNDLGKNIYLRFMKFYIVFKVFEIVVFFLKKDANVFKNKQSTKRINHRSQEVNILTITKFQDRYTGGSEVTY